MMIFTGGQRFLTAFANFRPSIEPGILISVKIACTSLRVSRIPIASSAFPAVRTGMSFDAKKPDADGSASGLPASPFVRRCRPIEAAAISTLCAPGRSGSQKVCTTAVAAAGRNILRLAPLVSVKGGGYP